MLNEADHMIQCPRRYTLEDINEMGCKLENFAEELRIRMKELNDNSGLAKDLIDKCISKSTILYIFYEERKKAMDTL